MKRIRAVAVMVSSALFIGLIASGTATAGPTTVPEAPTHVRGVTTGDEGTQISWSTPPDDGGDVIIGYQIRAQLNNTRAWFTLGTTDFCGPTETGCVAETDWMASQGVVKYHAYRFKVRAYNTNGWGSWSSVSPLYAANPYGRPRPAAVTELSALGCNSTILVRWHAPVDQTDYPLTYIVNWRTGSGHWNATAVTYTQATRALITGLDPERAWFLRVYAIRTDIETGVPRTIGPVHLPICK